MTNPPTTADIVAATRNWIERRNARQQARDKQSTTVTLAEECETLRILGPKIGVRLDVDHARDCWPQG